MLQYKDIEMFIVHLSLGVEFLLFGIDIGKMSKGRNVTFEGAPDLLVQQRFSKFHMIQVWPKTFMSLIPSIHPPIVLWLTR